jgi:hypothetical protein
VIHRILHEEPDLGALDGRLRPVVAACLNKDPSCRPSARGLMDELMGHHGAATTSAAHPPSAPPAPAAGAPSAWRGMSDSAAAAGLAGSNGMSSAGRSGDPSSSADNANPFDTSSSAGSDAVGARTGARVAGLPGSADAATAHIPAGASAGGSGVPGSPDAATAYLPAGGSSASSVGGAGRSGASGPGTREAATMRLPLDGSGSYAGTPGSPAFGEVSARRMPASGPPSPGGYPGAPGPSGPMAGPSERRKGRTALIVAAVAAVLVSLVAGIGALTASRDDGKNGQAAAPPPSSKQAHRPVKRRTPSASRSASHRPAAAMSVKTNPYTPQRLCGGGYRVVDRHGLGEARVYLLYNSKAGANCVVTMVPKSSGKVPLSTSLVVKGGDRGSRSGAYPFYAGPIRLPARGRCVMWGGSSRTARWTSGWSHCGK